jgi:hypothetical protein
VDGCLNYHPNPDRVLRLKDEYVQQDVTFPLVDRNPQLPQPPFPFYNHHWYISSETDATRTLSVRDSPAIAAVPWQQPGGRILIATDETDYFNMWLVYYVDAVPDQIISRAVFNWSISFNGHADGQNKTWQPSGAGILKGFPMLYRTEPKKAPPIAYDAIDYKEENCQ